MKLLIQKSLFLQKMPLKEKKKKEKEGILWEMSNFNNNFRVFIEKEET